MNVELLVSLVSEHKLYDKFVWFWQARKYIALFFWVTSECQKRKVAQRHLVYRGISVLH